MEKEITTSLIIGLLISSFFHCSTYRQPRKEKAALKSSVVYSSIIELEKEIFEILKSTCNNCHKRLNPFKIFSLKNMDRNSPKIYQQFFIKQRMPRRDKNKLTNQESQTLKRWIKSPSTF